MIRVSAPGKVHLMGEHAVVYGKPALLAAINKRLTVGVEGRRDGDAKTRGQDNTPLPSEVEAHIYKILDLIQSSWHEENMPAMDITIDSQIPFGYHLGSSAALAVATIGAVSYFVKKIWNPMAINKLAFEAEKFVHGNPSGGDNTIVTMGGFVWFRKELPFLKSIWQLPMKLSPSLNHFMLVNTGKPEETTGEMVELVASTLRHADASTRRIFEDNEKQTRRIAVALKEGDEKTLIDAMQKGERTLEEMDVVSEQAILVIRKIEANGGAAKILGGGGKKGAVGFLLAYHKDQLVIEDIGKKFGYPVEFIALGEDGVRLEDK